MIEGEVKRVKWQESFNCKDNFVMGLSKYSSTINGETNVITLLK